MNKNLRFLIVGLGLMGGSYAYALSKRGYHVWGIDINRESIDYALTNRIIEKGACFDADLVKNADVIFFGLYPKTMIAWLKGHRDLLKPGCLISDVSGVKCHIADTAQALLQDLPVEFIASHPMAGKEVSGVTYANDQMFEQANFIITPTNVNTDAAISFLKEFAKELGFANISVLSPQKHDEMIGYVSQLTHVIAISLMNANDNPDLVHYTGDSFRDLTRIARINEHLWTELFFLNKDNLIREIDDFETALQALKQTLLHGDADTLKQMMITSTKRRSRFDKKKS